MPEQYVCKECGHYAVEIHPVISPGQGLTGEVYRADMKWICPDPRCHNSIAKLNGRIGFCLKGAPSKPAWTWPAP